MAFNPQDLRQNFPELSIKVNGKDLVYFDNAASTLKHEAVSNRVHDYNKFEASNVHRGAHFLSNQGTENYEAARRQVQKFINAKSADEVIFTRGTTESINLVAASYCDWELSPGDEIVLSPFEHHSNIVPWQEICKWNEFKIRVIDFDPKYGVTSEAIDKAITSRTGFVSCLWYSNSFGHRLPIEEIISKAKKVGAKTLIDGAQAPLHEKIDVQKLDCDFLAFSGHKMFAPYGIGALYGKTELLEMMRPYQTGGSMIDRVSFKETRYADIPQKFEAGTPNVGGAIGLGKACETISELNIDSWHSHLSKLRDKLVSFIKTQDHIELYYPVHH